MIHAMRIAYKYRLFPTSAQRTSLEQTLEVCRWLYNKTLETRKNAWEQEKKTVNRYETINLIPQWKTERPALTGVHSQVLQEVCTRVDLAFKAFFRRVKAGEEPGYPRFKGYGRYDSFTYPQSGFSLLANGRLRLSKIGDVKIKLHRPFTGKCKTLTIRRDAVGNWYACFSCEVDTLPLPPTDKVVGVDLGLTTFAALSNGEQIARQRWMKRDEKDITRLQRKKEKFAKGSPERRKVIHALCHAYERAANRRRNFAHQESRKLVNKYQFIAFEDLDIQDMQVNGNKTISRGIADVAWGQFVQFAAYKAECASRGMVRVNPKGTTQMCSGCGVLVPKDLSVRVHECPDCGLTVCRDVNAAMNILARGLASINAAPDGPRRFRERLQL
jgi:putative transposase